MLLVVSLLNKCKPATRQLQSTHPKRSHSDTIDLFGRSGESPVGLLPKSLLGIRTVKSVLLCQPGEEDPMVVEMPIIWLQNNLKSVVATVRAAAVDSVSCFTDAWILWLVKQPLTSTRKILFLPAPETAFGTRCRESIRSQGSKCSLYMVNVVVELIGKLP